MIGSLTLSEDLFLAFHPPELILFVECAVLSSCTMIIDTYAIAFSVHFLFHSSLYLEVQ